MVSPISLDPKRRSPARSDVPLDGAPQVAIPFRLLPATALLAEVLNTGRVEAESRWIWLAHPSLKQAAENALGLFTLVWPDPDEPTLAACAKGIGVALRNVLRDRDEGEPSRDAVTGHFLDGLATIAGAVARTTAYGSAQGRILAQYDHNRWDFVTWAHEGQFDAVHFVAKPDVRQSDRRGLETVFVSKVAASTQDVGCYLRHRA